MEITRMIETREDEDLLMDNTIIEEEDSDYVTRISSIQSLSACIKNNLNKETIIQTGKNSYCKISFTYI